MTSGEMGVDLGEIARRRPRERLTGERFPERDRLVEPCRPIAKTQHRGVDIYRSPDRVHQHRRRRVIGHDDHEPGEIVERELQPVAKETQHAGADVAMLLVEPYASRRIHGARCDELGVVLQDERLRGALSRQDAVRVNVDRLARAQVPCVHAKDAWLAVNRIFGRTRKRHPSHLLCDRRLDIGAKPALPNCSAGGAQRQHTEQ
jgi:hypothetical protein